MFGEKVYSMVKNILSNLRLYPKGGNVSPNTHTGKGNYRREIKV